MIKKLAFLATFLVTITMFSGCSLFSSTSDAESFEGVLTEQVSGDQYPGTHLLTSDDGEFFALTSTVLNLSSEQYLGNKVKILGELNENEKVVEVTGISVIEVLPKETGKASWIVYMNQNIGFKLKYYDSWVMTDNSLTTATDGGEIVFTAPLQGTYTDAQKANVINDKVVIKRISNLENLSVEDFGYNYLAPEGQDKTFYNVSESKIGVNQQSSYKFAKKGGNEMYFFVGREKYVYEIVFYPLENFNNNNLNTFHEMLLEFQFVPFAETPGETTESTTGTVTTSTTTSTTPSTTVTPTASTTASDTATTTSSSTTSSTATSTPSTPTNSTSTVTTTETTEETISASSTTTTDTTDYSSFSEFESVPYHFKAKYPSSWYYAGTKGVDEGVLHEYSFSNQPVTDENKFASLKILSGDLPSGQSVTLPNGQAVKKYEGTGVSFYVKVNDKVYCVQGTKDKEDLFQKIAGSITYLSETQPTE
jgi:hypothetical protein